MTCARLTAMPLTPLRLGGDAPPTLLFVPPDAGDGLPLVLLGHGAHLSKDDPVMQMLAKGFCRGVPAAVALMDCPGHGERRTTPDGEFDADIRHRMSDPQNLAQVRDDWLAVEPAARAADARITGKTGYAGFSMGAVFGLAMVAELPSVVSAVFALGGLTPDAPRRNEMVRIGAQRLGEREVLMLNMTRDEHFPIGDAIEVFETIPGPKRMGVWHGGHVDIPPEAVAMGVDFFARTLV
jgi:predicted esterase